MIFRLRRGALSSSIPRSTSSVRSIGVLGSSRARPTFRIARSTSRSLPRRRRRWNPSMKDSLGLVLAGGLIPLGRRYAWGRSPSINKRALTRVPSRVKSPPERPTSCSPRRHLKPDHGPRGSLGGQLRGSLSEPFLIITVLGGVVFSCPQTDPASAILAQTRYPAQSRQLPHDLPVTSDVQFMHSLEVRQLSAGF